MRRATSTLALLFGSGCTLIGGISDYEVARCVGSSCDAGPDAGEGGLTRDGCAGEECAVDGSVSPPEAGGPEAGLEGGIPEGGVPDGGQLEAGAISSPVVTFHAAGTLSSVDLSWTTSTTSPITGFRLRRDNQLVAELATGSTFYVDKSASPGRLVLDSVTTTQGTRSDGIELQWHVLANPGSLHEYAITAIGRDGKESASLTSTAARLAPPDWTISWQRQSGMDKAEILPGTQTSTLDTLAPLASVSTSVAVASPDYSRGVVQLRGSVELQNKRVSYTITAHHSDALSSTWSGTGARGGNVDDLALQWQRATSPSASFEDLSGVTGMRWYDNSPALDSMVWYRLRASAAWVSETEGSRSSTAAMLEGSTSIAAGADTTCVRRTSGALSCWGDMSQGPSATESYLSIAMSNKSGCALNKQNTPVCWGPVVGMSPPFGAYTRLAVGESHACGLTVSSTLACWGANQDGRAPPGPSTQTYSDVAAGKDYTCAIRKSDGSIDCFGSNDRGQAPSHITSATYTGLSGGDGYTCALRASKRLECLGSGLSGAPISGPSEDAYKAVAVGTVHACAIRNDTAYAECWGSNAKGQAAPPITAFASIASGADHSCGLTPDGRALCWGSNLRGQAAPLPPFSNVTAIAMGDTFGCSAADQGLSCWGLMDPNTSPSMPSGAFKAVGAGSNHVCAVTLDGEVRCTGSNTHGQASPPATPGMRFLAIAAGDYHSCGRLESGKVVCWGGNSFSQAPPGPSTDTYQAIVARRYATCGLRDDGTRECWGQSSAAAPTGRSTETFSRLSIGWSHGCGVTLAGVLFCWGDYTGQNIAVQAGETFSDVAAGDNFTCALAKDTRRIKCWAGSSVMTVPDEPFVAVHAAQLAACGVRSDGKVVCWGDNSLGQAPRL